MTEIADRAFGLLTASANPENAGPMAAYMKSRMPFHGVMSTDRKVITRQLVEEYPAYDHGQYARNVRSLWGGSFREDQYLAIGYARSFPRYVTVSNLRLYRTMVVQGAWWDFVDEIASHLVGSVLVTQPEVATPRIAAWIGDKDLWLRRTSIICQLRRKNDTDIDLLEQACTQNLADTEFFIRKAIGWALREFAKTDARWVVAYVHEHRGGMSGLTYREATKHLDL
ncbi:MAG: DNA alkylation repair protein [Acidimicrobiia bacterium]